MGVVKVTRPIFEFYYYTPLIESVIVWSIGSCQFAMTLNDREGHSAVAKVTDKICRTLMQYFSRFQLTQRAARSLGDS